MAANASHTPPPLSHGAREYGTVWLEGEPITEVARWYEAGHHVLRSTEFDISAADPDFGTAVERLLETLEDLGKAYLGPDAWEDPTPDELRMAMVILDRFTKAYRAGAARMEAESVIQNVQRKLNRRVRGGQVHRGGFRRSEHQTSSKLQPA